VFISTAYQLKMSLKALPISLTWAYQQRYSANMGLSAALLSQYGLISSATQSTWANQQRYSAYEGLISTA